jgi:(S)-citramalyl-CoA lyase
MLDVALKPARSWLFTPATCPDRFAKAAAYGPDVAIIDLEDSVAPGDKDHARDAALGFLKTEKAEGERHAPRINGLG